MKLSEVTTFRGNHSSGCPIYSWGICCIYAHIVPSVKQVSKLPNSCLHLDKLIALCIDTNTELVYFRDNLYVNLNSKVKAIAHNPLLYANGQDRFQIIPTVKEATLNSDATGFIYKFPKGTLGIQCYVDGENTKIDIPRKTIQAWGFNVCSFIPENFLENWGYTHKYISPIYTMEELSTYQKLQDNKYSVTDRKGLASLHIDDKKFATIQFFGKLNNHYYYPSIWNDPEKRYTSEQYLRVATNELQRKIFHFLSTDKGTKKLYWFPTWEKELYNIIQRHRNEIEQLMKKL